MIFGALDERTGGKKMSLLPHFVVVSGRVVILVVVSQIALVI